LQGIVDELKEALHKGLQSEPVFEKDVEVIEGQPYFVDTRVLNEKVGAAFLIVASPLISDCYSFCYSRNF
jgi:hypothetical protein